MILAKIGNETLTYDSNDNLYWRNKNNRIGNLEPSFLVSSREYLCRHLPSYVQSFWISAQRVINLYYDIHGRYPHETR